MQEEKSRRKLPTREIAERFAEKTRRAENGCLEWTGYRLPEYVGGYGVIYAGSEGNRSTRRTVRAHKVAWELKHGPVPEGLVVMHEVCDNPACVDVEHLKVGTQRENLQSMERKGRGGRRGGSRRTLTPEQIEEVRAQYQPKGNRMLPPEERTSAIALAMKYGVSRFYIYKIVREEKAA